MAAIKWKFLLLALLFIGTASAQNAKIIGVWKVVKMEAEGVQFDVTDIARLEQAIYLTDLKSEPTKVFKPADSLAIQFAAAMLYTMFEDMTFKFNSNKTYAMNIKVELFGKVKSERVEGKYRVQGNKIEFVEQDEETKKEGKEDIPFQLTDANTLVFNNFKGARGMSIILKRI